MQKQTTMLALALLAFLAACGEKQPPAPQTDAAPMPAEYPVSTVTTGEPAAKPAAVTVAQAGDRGKKVYDTSCMACHAAGVAGAPKFGDKAAWAPRIAQGKETLYTHSIQGFKGKTGVMPPKGGFANLSDADVKAAVDYMVKNAQ